MVCWLVYDVHSILALRPTDDKVTVLESEKMAWENSPEAQAIREALNPWRNSDAAAETREDT